MIDALLIELKEAFVGKLKAHYNNKPCELDFLT